MHSSWFSSSLREIWQATEPLSLVDGILAKSSCLKSTWPGTIKYEGTKDMIVISMVRQGNGTTDHSNYTSHKLIVCTTLLSISTGAKWTLAIPKTHFKYFRSCHHFSSFTESREARAARPFNLDAQKLDRSCQHGVLHHPPRQVSELSGSKSGTTLEMAVCCKFTVVCHTTVHIPFFFS